MNLKDKTAVIVGASGGLGREIALRLAKEGVNLALVSKNEEKLKLIAKEVKEVGSPKAEYYECDVRFKDQIAGVVRGISKDFGSVDLLVNAAGVGVYKPFEELSLDEWEDSFAVNVDAPFMFTHALLPLLSESKVSKVVSMGSGMGRIPRKSRLAYCASKFALRGWSLTLSKEYKGKNLKFVLMTMGSILTGFGPLTVEDKRKRQKEGKHYFTPEWVADKLVEIVMKDKPRSEYKLYPSEYAKQNEASG